MEAVLPLIDYYFIASIEKNIQGGPHGQPQ